MSEGSKAQQLKADGNKLFSQQDFKGAYAKYSEAIAEDGTNAVLYANRAACSIGLKNYTKAEVDSRKATQLDPGYAKAWARLATCLDYLSSSDKINDESVRAWQKALNSLPKENISAAEIKQKVQYEAGLKAANRPRLIRATATEQRPWEMAAAMRPELLANKAGMMKSSAWVILGAYEEFMEGVQAINAVKKIQTPRGTMLMGALNGLAALTNGILRDERAFHMTDANFLSKYNDQVIMEATQRKAWTDAGPDVIITEAQERLRQNGWEDVRPALSTSIRGLIMRAFMENGLRGNPSSAVHFYGQALKVLDWGRNAWRDVPTEDCGVIFQPTFIRGVRSLRIDVLMQAYAKDPGPNSKHSLEDILQEADYILRELEENPLGPGDPVDPGFISSFVIYPKAQALSMKGFYHGKIVPSCYPDTDAAVDHYRKSANFYIEAADTLPDDDESHAYFLNCGVQNLFNCGTPLRETLAVLERIRLAIPKMERIWKHSSMSKQGRDQVLARAMESETMLRDALARGEFTLDDKIKPEWK